MTGVEYLWQGWQKVDWMYRNYWELLASDKSGGDSHYIINICHPDTDPLIITPGSSGTIMGSFVEKIIQNYTKGWMFELPSWCESGDGMRTIRRNCWNPAKCHRLNTGQYVIKNTVSITSSRKGIFTRNSFSSFISGVFLVPGVCMSCCVCWCLSLMAIDTVSRASHQIHWHTPLPRVITVTREHYFLMWPAYSDQHKCLICKVAEGCCNIRGWTEDEDTTTTGETRGRMTQFGHKC